jgi:hypothetical protein
LIDFQSLTQLNEKSEKLKEYIQEGSDIGTDTEGDSGNESD